ncbi:MBOAT family O-acyltransferase [Lewinella sp. IMCC34183]|uniref:MBOAT family O-acyltransferase n=1 Tax=Lewinella sp. IMCC34183 TaxID=2248762 RepID=UPI000E25676B|nr:MBOAT family O-acyltransferase [Lewinella sp. IMCC34183]
MLFNSVEFGFFLPLVFLLYWFVCHRSLRLQNYLVVAASYFAYGWWDWRFLSLLLTSTVVDYTLARLIGRAREAGTRKLLLGASIAVNLGVLAYFKYFNFFLDNFVRAFTFFGHEASGLALQIILPVGISFYTFQTLSYTIDVYRGRIQPTTDFIAFAAFVSFFPQLVAGPIERATHLLPQFLRRRTFDVAAATDGCRQILWGLFKKVVIADNSAIIVNDIFGHSDQLGGSTLLVGAVFFAFQIYGDFSGYSDIAIGTARLFGFDLMQNFAYPYFSRNIGEFWRRWHISLSTWFKDYLYIPLGGSRGGQLRTIRNTFIIFLVSGFWHGAAWTFVIWGFLNALYFLPLLIRSTNRLHLGTIGAGGSTVTARDLIGVACTFTLTVLAWIFFRADDVGQAMAILGEIFSPGLFTLPEFTRPRTVVLVSCFILGLLVVEWQGRELRHPLENLEASYAWVPRQALYYGTLFLILYFFDNQQPFVYFQF